MTVALKGNAGSPHANPAITVASAQAVGALVMYFTSTLRTSKNWLAEYWSDTAEVMAECITAGDALPVLKGLDVVLDAIQD